MDIVCFKLASIAG